MKNFKKTMLCILTLTACSFSGTALALVQKTAMASGSESAPATALFSPVSYEQYLDLTAPTDMAVCEDYTAIADGNTIYVYDRNDGVYREYIHEYNLLDPLKNNIAKLQFDEAGNLFFHDMMSLHCLKPSTLAHSAPEVEHSALSCTNFYLHKNILYFIYTQNGITQLSQLDIADGIDPQKTSTLIESYQGGPTITVYENDLYYTQNSNISKYNLETDKTDGVAWLSQSNVITSIQIVDGILCCTDNLQNFYAYDLEEITGTTSAAPLVKAEGKFSALASFGDMVYAVNGNTVRQFSTTDLAFTDYEISNRSSSVHRMDGATDTYLAGNLLLIADNGNQRISICDTQTGKFLTPIQNTLTASYLVSDGNTVLAANQDGAVLYSMQTENYGAAVAKFDDFIGNIVGAASVYGNYYLVLDNYFRYSITEDETGKWVGTEIARPATRTPSLLTADAYGNLYIASGNKIHRYTEEEFLSADKDKDGEEVYSNLPQTAKKIMVDYEGNLYALADSKLYKLGEDEAYPLNTPLVYTDAANINSFAFGIERNQAFVLYAENYVAQTSLLNLSTVQTIAVDNTTEDIFAEESANFSVVQTQPDALVVYFDIHSLQGAEVFPYLSYERRVSSFIALKIGETEQHNVLAVFNEKTQQYQTCLVLKAQCTQLPTEEYHQPYETEKIGYLTNAVSLYKFPYLTQLLTVFRLNADTQIILLGEIDKLDHPYYHIAFVDDNGVRRTGFVPKAYVTEFSGMPPVPETTTFGSTKNNNDTIFRLCYLILGFGVICILADVILLMKHKDDEEKN